MNKMIIGWEPDDDQRWWIRVIIMIQLVIITLYYKFWSGNFRRNCDQSSVGEWCPCERCVSIEKALWWDFYRNLKLKRFINLSITLQQQSAVRVIRRASFHNSPISLSGTFRGLPRTNWIEFELEIRIRNSDRISIQNSVRIGNEFETNFWIRQSVLPI